MHEERCHVRDVRPGVTIVGDRTWPTHRFVAKENIRAFCRRLRWMRKQFEMRRLTFGDVEQRLMSWFGHAGQAGAVGLARVASSQMGLHVRVNGYLIYTIAFCAAPLRDKEENGKRQNRKW